MCLGVLFVLSLCFPRKACSVAQRHTAVFQSEGVGCSQTAQSMSSVVNYRHFNLISGI